MRQWQFPLILIVQACGANSMDQGIEHTDPMGGETGLTPETAFPGSPVTQVLALEDADGRLPNYIDRLEWQGELIDFIQIYAEPEGSGQDAEASVLVYRKGFMDRRDIVDVLHENAPVPLSPAEIWMNLAERDDIPHALVTDHVAFAKELGRTDEFMRLEHLVEQKDLFTDPTIYPSIPVHTWQRKREQIQSLGDTVARYSCSEVQTSNALGLVFVGSPTAASSCSTAYNEAGWVRIAAFNYSFSNIPAQIGQLCYGHGATAWTCFEPGLFAPGQYAITDWNSNLKKRMAMGLIATRLEPPPFEHFSSALFAVGKSVPN